MEKTNLKSRLNVNENPLLKQKDYILKANRITAIKIGEIKEN